MADCIAEVDDVSHVTAGLDAEEGEALPAVPGTAPIRETVLLHRLDKSKKAEATAIKEKELMQKTRSSTSSRTRKKCLESVMDFPLSTRIIQ